MLGVVGIGKVEGVITEGVLKHQDWDLVLSEHGKNGAEANSHIVSEIASCVDQDVVVLLVELEHVIEGRHCGKTSAIDQDDGVHVAW